MTPAIASILVATTLQVAVSPKHLAGNLLPGRTVTWTGSTPAVATVSSGGLVTGVAVESATIAATSDGQGGGAAVTGSPGTRYAVGNGNNYYAAPGGSDANPCTFTSPCYSMAGVAPHLHPGDNAHFAAGNYTWSYSANRVAMSGTAGAPITYISDTKWGAKIYGAGEAPIFNDGDYVQIINFDVTGSGTNGITANGNYNKVLGNRVHDLPGAQLVGAINAPCCDYSKVGVQIIGNVVDNIGPWQGSNQTHGIYGAGPYAVIENNIVTRVAAAGIHTYHGATHMIVSNNVVANCSGYGIVISADGALTANDYSTVDNNIVVNIVGSSVSPGNGIEEWPAVGSHNVYNNNILYNNTHDWALISGTQSGTLTLTATQFSALFVHYTGDMTGDYHLQSGAVALAAGTTACAPGVTGCVPTLDMDGLPWSVPYNIGAYGK